MSLTKTWVGPRFSWSWYFTFFFFSFFQLNKDLLCRYYVYRVMPSTHHSSSYVDPGYRGTGGKTGKWGSSFWEKTLPTCTIMTQPGWETVVHKPIALKASAAPALWASQSPFCLVSFTFSLYLPTPFSPALLFLFLSPLTVKMGGLRLWDQHKLKDERKYRYIVIYLVNST